MELFVYRSLLFSQVELADNQIKGSDLTHLAANKKIQTLKLGNNKINTVAELEALKGITDLKNLDLEGNPLCETAEYKREDIFAMLPGLEVSTLDMFSL